MRRLAFFLRVVGKSWLRNAITGIAFAAFAAGTWANPDTPSIIFLIDNSGSMRNTNDPTGTRFTVTRALLDSIYENQPQAEVGLVVFREHLFFDTTTTEYYTQYFRAFDTVIDGEPDQAYLPLMTLNQTYGGKLGISIIKDILQTDSTGKDLAYQPLYRYARPNNGGGETNINGAFLAIQQAFLSAKNPPAQQFVIFFSDGEPAGTSQAGLAADWFSSGENMPTTFTVYFTSSGIAPQSLQIMTQNIRANGYSTTNAQSGLWALQTNFVALMNLLMENIMPAILDPGSGTIPRTHKSAFRRAHVAGIRLQVPYEFSRIVVMNSRGSVLQISQSNRGDHGGIDLREFGLTPGVYIARIVGHSGTAEMVPVLVP